MSEIAERVDVDPERAVLIIQDMQNDVMMEGGAWAETGAPEHAKEQNVVENVKRLAEACRAAGIPVFHVHYIVEDGAPGLKLNAGLFQGVAAEQDTAAFEIVNQRSVRSLPTSTPASRSDRRYAFDRCCDPNASMRNSTRTLSRERSRSMAAIESATAPGSE